jgi:hypothetical protein
MYDDRKLMTEKQRDRRTMILLGVEVIGLIAGAFAIGLIAGGCGEKSTGQVAATNGSTPAALSEPGAVTAVVASQTPGGSPPEGDYVASADSLPPEVVASVTDTLVVPGAAIEITAQASADAMELTLWDGLGKKQPFVYDEPGKVWRAFYRVPLKSADRVGLSVTAKNNSSRWRRVWVFLDIDRGLGQAQPTAIPENENTEK